METQQLKDQATKMFNGSKNWLDEQLTKFNDLSLWDKMIVLFVLHYGVRFFKPKSEDK